MAMLKKALMIALGAITAFLLQFAFTERFDRLSKVDCNVSSVVAQYGDTHWKFAERYCRHKDADIRAAVDEIVKLNGVNLQVGQLVILPQSQP
jgi:hypothetical protein